MSTATSATSATSATAAAARTTTAPAEGQRRAHPIRRATLVSGVVAALATTAVAAAADAAGVPLAVDGETIPLLGFAQMTLIAAVLGGLLAAALHHFSVPQRMYVWVTMVLTVLSCIPSVALPPDTATKIVLVGTHLLAAAIIVPALARHLRR